MVGIRLKTEGEPQTGRIAQVHKPVVRVAMPTSVKIEPQLDPGPPPWLDTHDD
jgi:hypothetical protein